MSDEVLIKQTSQENFHVHGCFASFFKGVLDWFDTKFYTKFNTVVIGTYDKAVQYFKQKKNSEKDVYSLPAISLDPMYDFGNEERGGRFLWQFARYGYPVGCYLSEHINLKEQDITVTPVFSRYQGTFEITMWLQSVYELMDLRVNLIQMCGGYGRWVRPEYFWSYLIFPDKITKFKKSNGEPIDWGNTTADTIHIDSINQHKLAIPIPLNAMWKMDSCADATTKYGADSISEYKMQATFTYEVNLPTYTVLNNMVKDKMDLSNVPDSDFCFTMQDTLARYPLTSPTKVIKYISDKHDAETASRNVYNLFEKDFVLYDIVTKKHPRPIILPDNVSIFPRIPTRVNYIVSGRLRLLDESTNLSLFELDKCDILLLESYRPEYLKYLRKCSGVICFNDGESTEFYSKVVALRKPCVCDINPGYHEQIRRLINTPITLDPLRGYIYRGLYNVREVHGDDSLTYKISEMIKKKFPKDYEEAIRNIPGTRAFWKNETINTNLIEKKVISDKCDGTTTDFYLGFHLSVDSLNQCRFYIDDNFIAPSGYYLTTTNIIFKTPPPAGSTIYMQAREESVRECKLAAIYKYTEEDLKSNSVTVTLPYRAETIDDFSIITYTGELEYEKEYKFNVEQQTVDVLVPPVVGEIIQFFYYFK